MDFNQKLQELRKQKEKHLRDIVFGSLDIGTALLVFLPFFAQRSGGIIQAASLLSLVGISPYLKIIYCVSVAAISICEILTFALQNCMLTFWVKNKSKLSIALSAVGALLFIVGLQHMRQFFYLFS